MLSATQGKYQLHKSSGRITNNINYIYYFTYFYKFEVQPYYEKFEPIIQSRVSELTTNIESLKSSHASLINTVTNARDSTSLLLASIDSVEGTVEFSVKQLTKHVKEQVEENKDKIQKSIDAIDKKIDFMNKFLNLYIEIELLKIKGELQIKKIELEVKIQCITSTMSIYIEVTKMLLKITTKITVTLKTSVKTISEIKDGKLEYTEIYNEVIEFSENFEKVSTFEKIERSLDRISDCIKHLKDLNTKFPDPICLTYEGISEYLYKLNCYDKNMELLQISIDFIKRQKKRFEDIIKNNSQNVKTTQRSEGNWQTIFREQSDDIEETYTELEVSYKKEVTKIEKLLSVKDTISKLLKEVCCEIDKLDEQVKPFKEDLKTVKKQLRRLKEIKDLNDKLKGFKNGTNNLQKIKEYTSNLKYDESKQDDLNGLNNFDYCHFYSFIEPMRKTVQNLLCNNDKKDGYLKDDKINLKMARDELKAIYNQIDNLGKSGTRIYHLRKVAYSINELKDAYKEIQQVKTDGQLTQQPCSHVSNSVYKKLTEDETILECATIKLQHIERNINSINANKPNSQALNNLHNNLVNLSFNAQSIDRNTQGLDSDLSPENFQIVIEDKCKELDKVNRAFHIVGEGLRKITNKLADYLEFQGEYKESIQPIIDKIMSIQKNEITNIPLYRSEMETYGANIKTHYDSYTCNFKCFKASLLELQRCLDYRVVQFLKCSLGTTVCRLRKLVCTVSRQCPDASCNSCLRQSLLGDKVYNMEEQLYRYYRLVLGHSSILESRLLVSRLYKCCVASYKVMKTLVEFEKCRCVKVCDQIYKPDLFKDTKVLTPHNLRHVCKHSEFHSKTVYQSGNHLCLCLVVMYKLYPSIAKCLCCMVDMELELANVMTKKLQRYNTLKGVYFSLTKLFIMAIKIVDKIRICMTNRYKTHSNCFCSKYSGEYREDCYYRWFIYVILYICHLVDDAFSLGYWETEKAMQCLSNLLSRLDAVCWHTDRRCVTISDKGSGGAAIAGGPSSTTGTAGEQSSTTAEGQTSQTAQSPQPPAPSTPPSPPTLKVRCCIVCVNVKVVCVSYHLVCNVHKYFGNRKSDKKGEKPDECNLENIDCFCKCEDCTKCLEKLKNFSVNDKLKCDLFKGLKDKLKSVNGTKVRWTVNCECKDPKCKCLCKEITKDAEVCTKLKLKDLSKVKDIEDFKCGCESVRQCCCCCKCEECGNGKKRKCDEKGCGHTNGHSGSPSTSQTNGGVGGQAAPAGGGAGTTEGQVKCPCTEGKKNGSEKCCCNNKDGKASNCNCTDGKPPAKPGKNCECCCFSCCADEENEDKKKDEDKEKEEQQQQQQEQEQAQPANGKNCPCKKKKKKKPKVHCKNNKKYKDKRCCCKCCPGNNGGEGAANGGTATTPNTNSNGAPNNNTTPTNEKDCCCCCKCKTKCKGAGGTSGGSASAGGNGCQCQNGMVQSGQQKPCNCYCCFECVHEKSALKSVCKQLAYELKSGILVLSKLASTLSIECCQIYP